MSRQTRLILVRHGQTDWNKENRLQGQTDIPINAIGEKQAKTFSERIIQTYPNIDAIYSSDLIRAYATALATAEKYNLQVHKKTGLREINWGEIEGMRIFDPIANAYLEREAKLATLYPDRRLRWDIPLAPGAESSNQILNRFKKELVEIAKSHPDQTVLVFSHGRAIRTLIIDLLDSEDFIHMRNCATAHILIDLQNEHHNISFHKLEQLID